MQDTLAAFLRGVRHRHAGAEWPRGRKTAAYRIDSTRRQVDTASWFGMLLVRALHGRKQQIEAGRLWQRTQLELCLAGVASQPLNQMIEIVDRERQLGRADSTGRRLVAWSGESWHPTFAFRFGSPRAKWRIRLAATFGT